MADKTPVPPSEVTPQSAHPAKGRRYRLWPDGDYCVFIVATEGGNLPVGTLTKVPDSPHFPGTKEAQKWIDNTGDLLSGKQVAIFRGYDIMNITAETYSKVIIAKMPKHQVAGPEVEGK